MPLTLALALGLGPAPEPDEAATGLATASLVVADSVVGMTPAHVGAAEGAGFYPEDLRDLGIDTYRLWTGMTELEWWDDDDAVDGRWDDSEYGTPSIDEIKADAGNGFANVIPWEWWDSRFDESPAWRYGTRSRRGMLAALAAAGMVPLVLLRTYGPDGQPEKRPRARWAPRPPVDEAFRNEWWEHCFAVAYWLNVRNRFGVTRFQVLNEPDHADRDSAGGGQGWTEYGGTLQDYVTLVRDAHDAVSYANRLAGLPAWIHAPVAAHPRGAYVAYTIAHADSELDAVDVHTYARAPGPHMEAVKAAVAVHDRDRVLEPIWVSEWGALGESYDSLERALVTADQLMTFVEHGVEGVTIFNLTDWSAAAGQDTGLIDLSQDGSGDIRRRPTETYYAYRLMIRGLARARERLLSAASGLAPTGRAVVTRDTGGLYVLVKNGGGSVAVDVSRVAGYGQGYRGSATVREYSARLKDEVSLRPPVVDGRFTFMAPDSGLALAQLPARRSHLR